MSLTGLTLKQRIFKQTIVLKLTFRRNNYVYDENSSAIVANLQHPLAKLLNILPFY